MTDPAHAAEAPWPALATLPRGLWRGAVATAAGDDAARLAHLAQWRESLLAGALPPPAADFGDAPLLEPFAAAVAALRLSAATRGKAALAEQVLRTLLWHLDRVIDRPPGESREAAAQRLAQDFRNEWQREGEDWQAVLALLPGLADLAPWSRDEVQGLLRAREWAEARRLAALMKTRPELAALIARIGRAAPEADAARRAPTAEGGRARGALRAQRTTLPDAPGELRGLALGNRLERMIPAEAQQIRHPVLRKVWRARRAEARLLHYDSVAELVDWRIDPQAPPRESGAAGAPAARGPMILALDTSASMRGAPEALAKAVVLEALRVAQAEGRALRLAAFGAAGELALRDLGPTREGVAALLALVGQGFDGGTDVAAPIAAALEAVHSQRWAGADLVVLSDGEFGCAEPTLAALDAARERLGLRVTGVLLGDRETLGLMQLADEIFWVRDWRSERGGAAGAFSPVHSKSLTALFFPGALDARARRHAPP